MASTDGGDAEPTRVLPHVFLGSKVHARDRALLARLQITHVLNVTPPKALDPVAGVPNFFEKDKTLTYRRCPIFDNKAEDISGVLEGCVAFMDQAKYYGRILVHCSKGVSRSTSMVVAYLMKIEGMSLDAALAFVVAKRPVANPNASFRQQLEDFGEKLRRAAALAAAKRANTNGATTRAIRGARGPLGPALPPTSRSDDSADDASSSSSHATTAIGPQLPPHLQNKASPSCSTITTASTAEDTSATASSARVAIGPSLPPHLVSRKRTHDDASISSSSAQPCKSTDAPRAKAARLDDASA